MPADKPKLNPDCPCPYRDCPNNRDCEACKKNHHASGEKTCCERNQKS